MPNPSWWNTMANSTANNDGFFKIIKPFLNCLNADSIEGVLVTDSRLRDSLRYAAVTMSAMASNVNAKKKTQKKPNTLAITPAIDVAMTLLRL